MVGGGAHSQIKKKSDNSLTSTITTFLIVASFNIRIMSFVANTDAVVVEKVEHFFLSIISNQTEIFIQ